MRGLGPEFVDITWSVSLHSHTPPDWIVYSSVYFILIRNAGGRSSEMTSELVKTCQSLIGVETCMHLTCTNMPAEKVDIALRVSTTIIHCDTSCPSLFLSRRPQGRPLALYC